MKTAKKENRALITIQNVLKNPGSVAGIIIFLLIIAGCILVPMLSS